MPPVVRDVPVKPYLWNVEVAGSSMEPHLSRGERVRIETVDPSSPLASGDIVLIQGGSDLILHRIVAIYGRNASRSVVFHRGDAGGGVGCCARNAVLGKAIGRLSSVEPLPAVPEFDQEWRRSFSAARRRALLFARVRDLAKAIGFRHVPVFQETGRKLLDRLLSPHRR